MIHNWWSPLAAPYCHHDLWYHCRIIMSVSGSTGRSESLRVVALLEAPCVVCATWFKFGPESGGSAW